jgi:hypothetical protein
MPSVEELYAAAARAGLTSRARWLPPGAVRAKSADVGFSAPDELVLDWLAAATDYRMTYPASALPGLKSGEMVTVDGVVYRVRQTRAVAAGEVQALLTRI